MKPTFQQLHPSSNIGGSNIDNLSIESQIVYKNFSLSPIQTFLGISIQKERMYVVQKKSISVFQYFDSDSSRISNPMVLYNKGKIPSLIKEIFLPFQISKYIITEKYICIKSKNKTQIRDSEFQKVHFSSNIGILNVRTKAQYEALGIQNSSNYDTVEQLELQCQIIDDEMISWKILSKRKSSEPRYLRQYWSQSCNILTKYKSLIKCKSQSIDPANKIKKVQICKPPLFVHQLGYIQNFYIWPSNSNTIQIGIYFSHKQHQNITENALYQICSFKIKQCSVKKIFYFDFKGTQSLAKSKDGPHLFFAICQNSAVETQKLAIMIFEVLPQQKITQQQNQNEALNNYLDQFNQLRKQKKSQQSISNNFLLNELLSQNQGKSNYGSSLNQPKVILETISLSHSSQFRKCFYNPASKVLWIDDTSDMTYQIKFLQSGDIKAIKQSDVSFIEKIQQHTKYEKKDDNPRQLEGIMYDNYPIYKHRALSLQIGLKVWPSSSLPLSPTKNQKLSKAQEAQEAQREIIQFNDAQLQNISNQRQRAKQNDDETHQVNQIKEEVKEKQCLQNSSSNSSIVESKTAQRNQKVQKIFQNSQTQTQSQQCIAQKECQKQVCINNLPELLKQLNFQKVQQVLIRFSSLFAANISKNINKLKETNNRAKQQIKTKINSDIFELIKQVFEPLMGDFLAQKIQKQVSKGRDFIEKVFNKHIEHFNLMLIEQRTKQQSIKKSILEEQLRSIQVIKQASFKFLDITKIRQMQKIAYNQVVIEGILGVSQKIEQLQSKVDLIIKQSQQIEKKVFQDINQIKETFNLLIQLDKDVSSRSSSDQSQDDSSCSASNFETEDREQDASHSNANYKNLRQKLPGQNRFQNFGAQFGSNYQYRGPIQNNQNIKAPNWNQFYQESPNYSYYHLQSHPSPPPPPSYFHNQNYLHSYPQNSLQNSYQNIPQNYHSQNIQNQNMMHSYQPNFYPPSSQKQPLLSQIRKQSQIKQNKSTKDKKKRKNEKKVNL